MTGLNKSIAHVRSIIDKNDLSNEGSVRELLEATFERRGIDLSDLTPAQQAELVASRTVDLLPSAEVLAEQISTARDKGKPFIVKFGIDPTSADVHFGHAVPMIVLSRFQRMGHQIVFIIGDITARIGDPSGRSDERPDLSNEQIETNLATYQQQVAPFFDFSSAQFRRNSEWLAGIQLPEIIEILSRVPVSMSLQRQDFRDRIANGDHLSMSEFMYSVVMALDSVAITADIELGGIDQLLNMQMGRNVMEIKGQRPQSVAAMPLIEGTDGSGAKMSKSKGNAIPLAADPDEIFGKVMSIPDRLIAPYFEAWTEWTDTEIASAAGRTSAMNLKKVLAGEAVSAVHGVDAAINAFRSFTTQFSKRSFSALESVESVDLADHGDTTIAEVIAKELEFAPSLSAVRRLAKGNGLRIVFEDEAGQHAYILSESQVSRTLREVLAEAAQEAPAGASAYLKAGRKIARLDNA